MIVLLHKCMYILKYVVFDYLPDEAGSYKAGGGGGGGGGATDPQRKLYLRFLECHYYLNIRDFFGILALLHAPW
jgi:hypothetical protein